MDQKSKRDQSSPLEDVFVVDNDVHIEEPPGLIAEYMDEPYKEAVSRFQEVYTLRKTPGYIPGMKIGDVFRDVQRGGGFERPLLTDGEAVEEELRDLHVDIGVLFPDNFLKLPVLPDVPYAVALASAYNDYLVDRFLDRSDHVIGAILVAPQDPHAAAEEIDRMADEPGMKAVFLPIGGVDRTYGHPCYEPIWEAVEDSGLPVAFHSVGLDWPEFPFNMHKLPYLARHTLAHELSLLVNAIHIVNAGVPVVYPDIDFAFLEAGLSWMPLAIYRLDREYMQHRQNAPLLEDRPSTYFRDFYIGTHPIEVPEDPQELVWLLRMVNGEERAVFATDWPHHDWDDAGGLQSLPISREAKERIWGLNAKQLYGL